MSRSHWQPDAAENRWECKSFNTSRGRLPRRALLRLGAGIAAGLTLRLPPVLSARGQDATPVPGDDAVRCDALLANWHATGGFSGVALVARGDKILFTQGYGLADRVAGLPNTPPTPFPIGSITKTFTALAIMQLAEAGRLRVDDPVTRFLPDFPATARDGVTLTLRHLLSHTGGVTPEFNVSETGDLRERIFAAVGDRLHFTPGTQFSYSNTGFAALGLVVEVASGQAWADYLHEHIFAPAGMQSSGIVGTDASYLSLALGYVAGSDVKPVYFEIGTFAAGAVYATAADLLRFDRALFGGQLLSLAGVERMRTPVQDASGYGLFSYVYAGRRLVDHAGDIGGFHASNIWLPEEDVTIIFFANQLLLTPDDIPLQLMGTLLGPE